MQPPPRTADPRTIAAYARMAETYLDTIALDGLQLSPDTERFVQALPRGKLPILDWGAGVGQTSAALAAMGCRVQLTDASPEMAAFAPDLGFTPRIEPFEALAADDTIYRGIMAICSLFHVRRADLPAIVAIAHAALMPGGVFYAKMRAGDAEGYDPFDRYICDWREDALAEILTAAGFADVETWTSQDVDFAGETREYTMVLGRRAE